MREALLRDIRNACKDFEVVAFQELPGKLRIPAQHLAPVDPAGTPDVSHGFLFTANRRGHIPPTDLGRPDRETQEIRVPELSRECWRQE